MESRSFNKVTSETEIILPVNILQKCLELQPGCTAQFRSRSDKGSASGPAKLETVIRLAKLMTESVRISVTVTELNTTSTDDVPDHICIQGLTGPEDDVAGELVGTYSTLDATDIPASVDQNQSAKSVIFHQNKTCDISPVVSNTNISDHHVTYQNAGVDVNLKESEVRKEVSSVSKIISNDRDPICCKSSHVGTSQPLRQILAESEQFKKSRDSQVSVIPLTIYQDFHNVPVTESTETTSDICDDNIDSAKNQTEVVDDLEKTDTDTSSSNVMSSTSGLPQRGLSSDSSKSELYEEPASKASNSFHNECTRKDLKCSDVVGLRRSSRKRTQNTRYSDFHVERLHVDCAGESHLSDSEETQHDSVSETKMVSGPNTVPVITEGESPVETSTSACNDEIMPEKEACSLQLPIDVSVSEGADNKDIDSGIANDPAAPVSTQDVLKENLPRKLNSRKKQSGAPKMVKCYFCNKFVKNYDALYTHTMKLHKFEKCFKERLEFIKDKQKVVCVKCKKTYRSLSQLHWHEKIIHQENEAATCIHCGITVKSQQHLRRHVQRHHTPDTPEFLCHLCPAKFKQQTYLNGHIRNIHENGNTVPCDVCNKVFKSQAYMNIHKRRTHVQRKHRCLICGQGFKVLGNLERHKKLMHSTEPNNTFTCQHCGQCFALKCNLKSHISRKHGTQQEFQCNICGKVFNKQRKLEKHSASCKKRSHRSGNSEVLMWAKNLTERADETQYIMATPEMMQAFGIVGMINLAD